MKKLLLLFLILLIFLTSGAMASGVTANTMVIAPSININVTYSDGSGGTVTKNASEFLVDDWYDYVKAIHGLLQGSIDLGSLGSPVSGNYVNLLADQDYGLEFPYVNRSNESVTVDINSGLIRQSGGRWGVTDSASSTIVEDQTGSFFVTVNASGALALEYVTLNVTVNIMETPSTFNPVSYNAFAGANVEDTYNQAGIYGGEATFNYQYVLQAEGYGVSINSRSVAITDPLSGSNPIPGAKLRVTIIAYNNNSTVATGLQFKDKIPSNCHLYFDDTPTVLGNYSGDGGYTWTSSDFSPQDNQTSGGGTIVTFDNIYIPPQQTVTMSYAITID